MLGDDGALVEQPRERLAEIDQPHVPHRLGEEAGVEQVHDGVLGAAGIDVDRHPVLDLFRVEGRLGVMRAGVAQEIPGRAHEGIQGIRLALGRAAALRAGGIDKLLVVFQRRFAGGFELGVLRQQHRQVFLRHRHDAAFRAVDHGDGRAPVALAGDQPVAQLVADRALCPSPFCSRYSMTAFDAFLAGQCR